MDDERYRIRKEEFLEWRVKDFATRSDLPEDSLRRILESDDVVQAKRGKMSVEDYLEYIFQDHCRTRLYEQHVAKYEQAENLEKQGYLKEAVCIYEALAEKGFIRHHMIIRLAKIYRKQKRYDDEIRILERGIYLYEHMHDHLCPVDQASFGIPATGTIEMFQDRLVKAKVLRAKARSERPE
ncbi:MAG TPA: hypothetical protein VGB72_03345 [Acidobacteriota bacterium]